MKFFISILTLSLVLVACNQESHAPADPIQETQSIPVRVAPVSLLSSAQPITASGLLASKEEVKLAFKVGGLISAVYAEEGRFVKKGQVMARLDPVEIKAQVSQAHAAFEKAQRDLQRAQRLYEDTVITLEQVQNLQTARDLAEASLEIAGFNLKQATIVAPASGIVLRRLGEGGEVISPGSPVFIMATQGSGQVIRVGLTDVDVVKVGLGDEATIHFDAYPGWDFPARISEIAAAADPRTGTFEVELSIDNQDKLIKNGFVGRVNIQPTAEGTDLRIPISALVEASPREAVIYVPNSQSDKAQKVILSPYQLGRDFLIVSRNQYPDLKQVITDGAKYVYPEADINIVPNAGPDHSAVN